MSSGVRVQDVWKRYGGVVAVGGVNLHASPGEFITLLGPSGSGKTTTLRIIAGLEKPDQGTVAIGERLVNGPRVAVPPHERRLGMVFQGYAIWPHMTVDDNVGFPLKMRRVPAAERRQRVREALSTVGLSELGTRYPSMLSGGQQQRVALARALVGDPEVILYDEPLSNLDAKLRERMRFEIRSLHDRFGMTAVYVTHDQQEAMVLSDRIYLIAAGAVVQSGGPRELFEHPANRLVADFIGQANVLDVIAIRQDGSVEIGGGLLLKVRPAARELETARGNDGNGHAVLIRPHHVRLYRSTSGAARGDNAFAGVVQTATFLGDRMRYVISLRSGGELRADALPSSEVPQVGDEVVALVRSEECILV